MKKLLVFSMLLVSFVSYGQQKITSFGKLQLGMSVNDMTELSNAKYIKQSEYFDKVYENKTINVYEAQLDTLKRGLSFVTTSTNVRIFQIGQVKLTDNITLKDVTLKFYNDKLYSIQV